MTMILEILITALFLFSSTLTIGYLPIRYFTKLDINGPSPKYLKIMSEMSVGMLFGTNFALVIPEAIEDTSIDSRILGISLMCGFLIVFCLDTLVHGVVHSGLFQDRSEDANISVEPPHFKELLNIKSILRLFLTNDILFALVIHGFADGIALAVTEIDESLKTVMFLAIFIHRIPATISLSSIMISRQKLSQSEAIINMIMFSLSSPLGYFTLLALNSFSHDMLKNWSSIFLMLSAGSLLYATIPALLGFDHDSNIPSELTEDSWQSYELNPPFPVPPDAVSKRPNSDINFSNGISVIAGLLIPVIISFSVTE